MKKIIFIVIMVGLFAGCLSNKKPDEPIDLKVNVIRVACDSTTFTWNAIPNATNYKILRDNQTITETTNTNYSDMDLEADKKYDYIVQALKKNGTVFAEGKATIKTEIGIDINSNLITENSIKFSWNEEENAVKYNVLRDNQKLDTTAETTFNDSGSLTSGGNYKYIVQAVNDKEDIIASGSATFITRSPMKLSYQSLTTSSVKITWPVVSGAIAYKIIKNNQILTTAAPVIYTDTNLESGKTYIYEIDALTSDGAQLTSGKINVTAFNPLVIKASEVLEEEIHLTWNAEPGIKHYMILKNKKMLLTTPDTSYIDQKVEPKTQYLYEVEAKDETNNIVAKGQISVMTLPGINITNQELGIHNYKFSWNAIKNATKYVIYRDEKEIDRISDTKYEENTLMPNTKYVYSIEALNSDGTVESFGNSSIKTKPIDNIIINNDIIGSNIYNFSWKKVSGADSYTIYKDNREIEKTSDTNYQDKNLVSATKYVYRVDAFNSKKQVIATGDTSIITICSLAIQIPETTDSEIKLEWNAIPGATTYKISRDGAELTTSNKINYDDTNLEKGKSYVYQVDALNPNGIVLSTATINTETNPSLLINISEIHNDEVHLNWTNEGAGDTYTIFRNDNKIIENISQTDWVDRGLAPSTDYNYTIQSKNTLGTIVAGGNTSAKTLLSIIINQGEPQPYSILVNWDAIPGITSYNIYRDKQLIENVKEDTPHYTDINVTPNSRYVYDIDALDANEVALSTGEKELTTNVGSFAINKTNTETGYDSLEFHWDDVPQATSYTIYRNNVPIASNYTSVTYVDTGLRPITDYEYKVEAYKGSLLIDVGTVTLKTIYQVEFWAKWRGDDQNYSCVCSKIPNAVTTRYKEVGNSNYDITIENKKMLFYGIAFGTLSVTGTGTIDIKECDASGKLVGNNHFGYWNGFGNPAPGSGIHVRM